MSDQFSVKVWDLPTRVFHWSLLACVAGAGYSVWVAQEMVWHSRFGYAVLTLCLFRLVWGVVGGHWSRFRTFPPSLRRTRDYLASSELSVTSLGHNPLGTWSIYAMLLFLLLQALSGLGSDDDAGFNGPLTPMLSSNWVSLLTRYHAELGRWVLISLMTVHILAVLWFTVVKRQALIQTMWHGVRQWPVPVTPSADHWRSRLGALLLAGLIATCVYLGLGLLPI